MDHTEIKKKINLVKETFPDVWVLPNIYLLHGELKEEELLTVTTH